MSAPTSGTAERLIAEAAAAPLSGWNFSLLEGRAVGESLPWDYGELARVAVASAERVLDIDTGGGELLASLRPPAGSVAVEPYPPNVSIAEAALRPYGIEVRPRPSRRLPCDDASVDLVLNRHGAFAADEIARVLRPGGVVLTQQVGAANETELNTAFEAPPPTGGLASADEGAAALCSAGLDVTRCEEAWPRTRYLDVGAVVLQLRMVGWQVPGFDLQRHRQHLLAIDGQIRRSGAFVVTGHRLMLQAARPY